MARNDEAWSVPAAYWPAQPHLPELALRDPEPALRDRCLRVTDPRHSGPRDVAGGSALLLCLTGACPRCGRGRLFSGLLSLAPACTACGLSYARFDQGDGPAVFAIFILGTLAVAGVIVVEVLFKAPYWLQALIWLPLVPLLSLGVLRLLKAWLVSEHYRHDADEGRLK